MTRTYKDIQYTLKRSRRKTASRPLRSQSGVVHRRNEMVPSRENCLQLLGKTFQPPPHDQNRALPFLTRRAGWSF